MRLVRLVGFALLVACGSETTGPGVSGDRAELLCRTYCDNMTGCGQGDPDSCRQSCRRDLARACGEHSAARYQCELELECNDQFRDCDMHEDQQRACIDAIYAACTYNREDAACPAGTVLGDACAPLGNGSAMPDDVYTCGDYEAACLIAGGNCNADPVAEQCSVGSRAGELECSVQECTEYAKEIGIIGYTCRPET